MAEQKIKGYQTGTFVVGNRLLDPEERSVQARTERSNTLTCGHRACQGCGEALGARYALAAGHADHGRRIAAPAATRQQWREGQCSERHEPRGKQASAAVGPGMSDREHGFPLCVLWRAARHWQPT